MNDRFRDRLRRLRREAASDAEPRRSLPESLRRRLAPPSPMAGDAAPGHVSGLPDGVVEIDGPDGAHAARVLRLPKQATHGDWQLDELFAADPAVISLLAGDDALASTNLRQAIFLDTETTGLGGGAGVYVFLIGLGWFERGRFRLWQGFLREPAEEGALLAAVAERLAQAELLVSFFGKSFDRHRLEDKMRICGVAPPFAQLPHLDLYHPFQRLTRGTLPDGRLATVESELCGLRRNDDLPGAFAPEAWFAYLSGRPHALEGVFRHNRDDVLSLVTLTAYLGRVASEARGGGAPLAGCAVARARALARAHAERGERQQALTWIEVALDRAGGAARDLEFARGETLRHLGLVEQARVALERVVDGPEDAYTVPALVALAKLLEHRTRNAGGAAAVCRRALDLVARLYVGAERARWQQQLRNRLARVERRARGPGSSETAG